MANYGKGDSKWFTHDRFGMFIHWGLYSMLAKHEWIRSFDHIDNESYQIYFDLFEPDMFNPREWARKAREAGMKYFVITTKHHEGFCMWDTKYTDFKITNTPYGKDILREIVDAFRAEGLHVGFYYSLLDWHHPDFKIDRYHPLKVRDDWEELNKKRNQKRYAKYMRDQVTELLTQYGKIDIIWFDFSYPRMLPSGPGKNCDDWESEKLIKLVRKLQPNILVNNRLNLPGSGDIETPEQYTPLFDKVDEKGKHVTWEGCQTFSGSWGYSRDEQTWKTPKQCIDMLINHVSRNGNLLMNVGPTSRGYLDYRAINCLDAFAEWMKYHGKAIYGCGMAPAEYPEPRDGRYTYNAETNRLYLHIMNWPFKAIFLPGLDGKLRYAQLLNDGSEIKWRNASSDELNADNMLESTLKNGVWLTLPVVKPNVEVPVVELILK
ncbi:MAG: alpha-L-fucosidase [Victivallales bacterium]|nr:alpha-L-fucosidase [Victivallales bacterium]